VTTLRHNSRTGSPPLGIPRSGQSLAPRKEASNSAHDLQTFPGENRDQRSYRSWLTELLTEAYRATVEHAVAAVFSDWRQEPTTSDALQMAGWAWSGTIPWIKPASRPRKGGFKQASEFITWGVKGTLDHSRDLYLPGYFIASQPRKDRVHITQKPIRIMQKPVRICPHDGTVLDPFTGSGTTGVAALREGRHFVGTVRPPRRCRGAQAPGRTDPGRLRPGRAGGMSMRTPRPGRWTADE
jgi:site-specific DNA-methyltransferase (adenine-specific)